MNLKKVVFMGTPQFAVPTFVKLAASKFKPILCITQPDRPKGRNRKLAPTAIKEIAQQYDIPTIQPIDVNDENTISKLKKISPDIIVTVAYGGFLKKEIRKLPKFGCINLHPSLLPKYRGPSPVNFTLFNNDQITGNTVFKIVAKIDSGPIIFQNKTEISKNECYTKLLQRLSISGADDVIFVLKEIEKRGLITQKQDHSKATFTRKLQKQDFLLNWNNSAEFIRNRVRGLGETPGLIASFREKRFKLIEVKILKESSQKLAGTIIEVAKNEGIVVSTKTQKILLKKVQPSGKKIMSTHAFNLGAKLQIGEKLEDGF